MDNRQQFKKMLPAVLALAFLALLFFLIQEPIFDAKTSVDNLSGVFFSWFGEEIVSLREIPRRGTSPAPARGRDRDDRDEMLLNPLDFGLPADAKEIPEKRTAQTAAFEIAPDKYAAVGVSDYLFAQDESGNWVIASDIGRQEDGFFVFDRLKGGVKASFDLNYPRYFLEQGDYWLMVGFSSPVQADILDPHSISYRLGDGVTLEWRVNGNQIEKKIRVDKPGFMLAAAFTASHSDNLTEELADNYLIYKNQEGRIVFSSGKLALTDIGGGVLNVPVKLVKQGQWFYYSYPSDNLIYPYIIDPSIGPNSSVSAGGSNNTSIGAVPWNDMANILASDNSRAATNLSPNQQTYYLVVDQFGFTIPAGATIDGIVVEWEKSAPTGSVADNAVRIVKMAGIGSTDRSSASLWPVSDTYTSYGGATDKWGESWVAADVNDVGFGAALSAKESGGVFGAGLLVDHVRITVYYTVAGDVTPPVISSVSASGITSNGVTITWTTNETADSQVEYGTTVSYGSQTTLDTNLVTSHSQALTGLASDTLYHYRVKSKDGSNNSATSGDYTFSTNAAGSASGGGTAIEAIKGKRPELTSVSAKYFYSPSNLRNFDAPFSKLLNPDKLAAGQPLLMVFGIIPLSEAASGGIKIRLEHSLGDEPFKPITQSKGAALFNLAAVGKTEDLPLGIAKSLSEAAPGQYSASGEFENFLKISAGQTVAFAASLVLERGNHRFQLYDLNQDKVLGDLEPAVSVGEVGLAEIAKKLGVPEQTLIMPPISEDVLNYQKEIKDATDELKKSRPEKEAARDPAKRFAFRQRFVLPADKGSLGVLGSDESADQWSGNFNVLEAVRGSFKTLIVDNLRVLGGLIKFGPKSITINSDGNKIIFGSTTKPGLVFGEGQNSTFSFFDARDANDLTGNNELVTITDQGNTGDLTVSGGLNSKSANIEGATRVTISAGEKFAVRDNNGSPLFIINDIGMIGIGSDNPTTMFQVKRNGSFTSAYTSYVSHPLHAPGFVFSKARGTEANPEELEIGDDVGRVFFNGFVGAPLNTFRWMAMLDAETIDRPVFTGDYATTGTPARFNFWVYGNDANDADKWRPRMTLTGEKVAFTNNLEVAGLVKITGGAPGAGKVLTSDANGLATWEIPAGGGLPSGTLGQTLRHDGTNWAANSNLYIDGTGKVGIGTATPTVELEVAGTVKAREFTTGGSVITGQDFIKFTDSGATIRRNDVLHITGNNPNEILVTFNTDSFDINVQKTILNGITYFLPPAAPQEGQVLTANTGKGGNLLSWQTPTGSGVGGQGTDNFLPRWTGTSSNNKANALEDSVIYQSDSGYIGIGTASPGEKLTISRTIANETEGIRIDNEQPGGYGSAIHIYSKQNFGANSVLEAGRIQVLGGEAWTSAATTDSDMMFWLVDNGTPTRRMTILSEGNVGIGTPTPGAKLDVVGSIKADSLTIAGDLLNIKGIAYQWPSLAPQSGQVLTADGNNVLKWQTPTGGGMTNPMTTLGDIIYGGTAGVPTRLPGKIGFLKSTGIVAAPAWSTLVAADIPNLDTAKLTTGILGIVRGGTGISTYAKGDIIISDAGNSLAKLPIGATNQILTVDVAGRPVWKAPQGGLPSGSLGQTLRHSGNDWVANNNIFNTGVRVGIGTTNPAAVLHASGIESGSFVEVARFSAPNGSPYITIGNGTTQTTGGYIFWDNTSGTLRLGPHGTNDFVIKSAGVGIGTINPTAKLHVSGSVRIANGTQGAGKVLTSDATGLATWQTPTDGGMANPMTKLGDVIYGGADGLPSRLAGSAGFLKSIGAAAPAWTILTASDIPSLDTAKLTTGILNVARGGTGVSAYAKGDVIFSHAANALTRLPIGAAGQILTVDGTGVPAWKPSSGNGLPSGTKGQTLKHDGTNWVANSNLYDNGGNVGIGTANPRAKLEVAGSSSLNTLILSSTGNAAMEISRGGIAQRAEIQLTTNVAGISSSEWTLGTGRGANKDDFTIYNTAGSVVPALAITKLSGNVGIGTIAPTAKLEVAGQIKITGGAPGAGKVLTSDATGLATWEILKTNLPDKVISRFTSFVGMVANELACLEEGMVGKCESWSKRLVGIVERSQPLGESTVEVIVLGQVVVAASMANGPISAGDLLRQNQNDPTTVVKATNITSGYDIVDIRALESATVNGKRIRAIIH